MRQVLFIAKILVVISFALLFVTSAMAQEPVHIQFNFDGCRNDGSIILPIGGVFVCPDKLPGNPNQDAYTGGELGKGWNELDLVPFRLTTNSGSQGTVTTDYGVTVAAGFLTAKGFPGYDVLSALAVNGPKSDASCSISSGPQLFQGDAGNPFSKDVITAIYRDVQIHQDPDTTCVFDWYQRLAVGSSQNPGASLHSYFFDQTGFQGHDSDIPIMLGAAQGLNKTMSAVQNTDHTWSISADPTAATVSFPNTCDPNQPQSKPLKASISWTKLPADPFNVTITTTVQATNPASRDLTLNLTDVIYAGSDQSNPLGSASTPAGGVVIPANTANFTVLTQTITVPNGETTFNDVATGTFVDTITNVPVGGTKTATASSPVQQGGAEYDNSATITGTETITGPTLTFSADAFSDATGAFSSYIAGTPTTGPVVWISDSQTDSGSVSFDKTVYISGPSQSSGSFSESGSLTGSDFGVTGFSVSAAGGASVSTDARVTLTINKTVDKPLLSGTQTFNFHVKNASDTEVAVASVTFGVGDTAKSVDVPDLAPGSYTISEDSAIGWTTDSDKQSSIALPSCSGNVTFSNIRHGLPLTVSKTANATFDRAYTWTVSKSVGHETVNTTSGSDVVLSYGVQVDQTGVTDSNWKVAGKITVSNPNDWEDFSGVVVADTNPACTVTGGDNVTIAAGGSVTLDYTCSFDAAPGDGSNTATATWDPTVVYTDDSTAQGSADYVFGAPSHLTDQTVTVTDTFNGGAPATLDTLTATDAAPFTSKKYDYDHHVQAPVATCSTIHNRVFLGDAPLPSAERDVKICGGSDLTVSKTAGTAFARTFNWNIQKSVDKTQVDQVGGSTTFKYSIVASETGFVDSGWTVSGLITVTNPNDWEDITVDVTDANPACAVTGGTGATVPAHSFINLPYSCALGSATNGTNVATATWSGASTPNGSAQGTAGYAFGNPTSVTNKAITVTDTFNGGAPVTLGTLYGSTTLPNSKTFTESRTINIPQSGCVSYPNVAAITQTGQHSDVTVRVCGPIASGAHTIGFWQNKNGQGIILASGPAVGTCKLATWLRQFAPFMDLSSTASCTSTALYVFNVVKNASSAGAAMNAMLKAQMLSTALSVYFSDPALGGNQIGAPSGPIANLTIDLTHIWGNQNSSGGFGGATSMTVGQMLVFAASQSNAGGSLWYGNVKTTQEKAKNAFDSINNQTAFGP